ncbi:hypothetical protein CERZMDRAFT_101608 [Cercospora zeae-maydis SCOH1-5]|uniref:Uncharacterized protein n=1 Tax=Cercospora zeae-maydis SCOH1-5 TaxID=717836 RepID=A0A6A6F4D1_9PEZI|nr:hypothetical protein CERZMDRAFT_101608 [Cercospora zeae-maydis SCOH1-5]
MNENAREWAKQMIANSNRAFRDEENAIYLVRHPELSTSKLDLTDRIQLEMTCAPPGNPASTKLINALEGQFVIWNLRPKSHVVASSTEMKLSWLVAIGNNRAIPPIPELESKEIKVTKVREGVVPEPETGHNQDDI